MSFGQPGFMTDGVAPNINDRGGTRAFLNALDAARIETEIIQKQPADQTLEATIQLEGQKTDESMAEGPEGSIA